MKKLSLVLALSIPLTPSIKGMDRSKAWLGYAKKESTVSLSQECAICLEPLKKQPPEAITILPCHDNHIFHHKCVGGWLKNNASCPKCRAHANLSLENLAVANPMQAPADIDNAIYSQDKNDAKLLEKVIRHVSLIASIGLITTADIDIFKINMPTNTILGKSYYLLGIPLLQFFIMRKMANFAEKRLIQEPSQIKGNLKNALIFPVACAGSAFLLKSFTNKFPNAPTFVDASVFMSCVGLYQHAIVSALEYTNK